MTLLKVHRSLVVASPMLLVTACLDPLVVKGVFVKSGPLDGAAAPAPFARPADVVIFQNALPEGFRLDNDLLTVVEGYEHKIHGVAQVVYKAGDCELREGDDAHDIVVATLRETAAANGGNAVVLATIAIPDGTYSDDLWDYCASHGISPLAPNVGGAMVIGGTIVTNQSIDTGNGIARGWVVTLRPKTADPL
jgi:hypothetical protein